MKLSPSIRSLAAIVTAMILWGAAWPSAKALSGTLTPEALAFWRFFLSFLALLPLGWYERSLRLSLPGWSYALTGAVLMALYLEAYFVGLQYGSAHLAGVLFTSVNPLFVFLLSYGLFRTAITGRDGIGLLLGSIGTAVILDAGKAGWGEFVNGGNAFFLISSFFWGATTVLSQHAARHLSPVAFSVVTAGIGSALFFIVAGPTPIAAAFDQSLRFWADLVFLAVVTSALASTIYFYAVRRLGSARASSYIFIVPLSAILLSTLFLGEEVRLSTVAGGALSLGAVALINRQRPEKN